MNDTMIKLIVFAAGAAVGSIATWKVVKTKYERIAQEEIDSVKEVFSKRNERVEENNNEPVVDPLREAYSDLVKHAGYSAEAKDTEEEGGPMADGPYIIPPEEFDEKGYKTLSLTYYADGVLTDEANNPIEDIDAVVGAESLEHFGDYEDDSVHVRNDDLRLDFEILLDPRRYIDVVKSPAHRANG